jgi:hypothetical protein
LQFLVKISNRVDKRFQRRRVGNSFVFRYILGIYEGLFPDEFVITDGIRRLYILLTLIAKINKI